MDSAGGKWTTFKGSLFVQHNGTLKAKKNTQRKATMAQFGMIYLGEFTIDEANELRVLLHGWCVVFETRVKNKALWIDLFGGAEAMDIIRRWQQERKLRKGEKL